HAVFVSPPAVERAAPAAVAALRRLEGRRDRGTMTGLTERAKRGDDPPQVAAAFLAAHGFSAAAVADTRFDRFVRQTREHLVMVGASLAAAMLVAVPLGVLAARRRLLGQGG